MPQLNPKEFRSVKAMTIADSATRMAFEDIAQKVEALARAANGLGGGSEFPAGAIVFWLGGVDTIPSGWEEATELRSRFPRGMASGGTSGATGGSTTHNHEVAGGTMGAPSAVVNLKEGTGTTWQVALGSHVHAYSDITSSDSSLPPYIDGVWIRKL